MKALVLSDGEVRLERLFPRPVLGEDEALIAVRLAGICATDLEMAKGYVPGYRGVLGHEFVGEVIQAADAQWIGRRVVGSINIGCGSCAYCRQGNVEHCPARNVAGIRNHAGVIAEYTALPLRNLHQVPEKVADETAVFTEPLAAALRIREQVLLPPSAKVAVIGPGRLGLLVCQVLALDGARVTILGRRAASLQLPAQMGFQIGLAAEMDENQYDLVVDTTGDSSGLAVAMRLTRPMGTLVMKSTFSHQGSMDLTPLVVKELRVVGSRCGPFVPALRLLAQEAVACKGLISATFPLDEAEAAFAYAAQPGVLKVLIRP